MRFVLTGAALMAFAPSTQHAQAQTDIPAPHDPLAGRFGGPFTLVSHDRKPDSDNSFRGQFLWVYFGYTHCPDVWLLALSVVSQALKKAGPEAAVIQPLFITIDPERDTVQLLGQYVKSFHPRLIALTGNEHQIAALAKAYKVHHRKVPTPSAADPHDYV